MASSMDIEAQAYQANKHSVRDHLQVGQDHLRVGRDHLRHSVPVSPISLGLHVPGWDCFSSFLGWVVTQKHMVGNSASCWDSLKCSRKILILSRWLLQLCTITHVDVFHIFLVLTQPILKNGRCISIYVQFPVYWWNPHCSIVIPLGVRAFQRMTITF